MKKIFIAALLAASSCAAFGQSAIIRGEASAGVYENIKSTSQALNVNIASGSATIAVIYSQTAIATLITSTTLVGPDAARKYLQVQNQDATNAIWVRCAGGPAVADGTGIKLAAGQTWAPPVPPNQACQAIAVGGTVVTSVTTGD